MQTKVGGFDSYANSTAAVSCAPLHLFASAAGLWEGRLSAQPLYVNVQETLLQFQCWIKDNYIV